MYLRVNSLLQYIRGDLCVRKQNFRIISIAWVRIEPGTSVRMSSPATPVYSHKCNVHVTIQHWMIQNSEHTVARRFYVTCKACCTQFWRQSDEHKVSPVVSVDVSSAARSSYAESYAFCSYPKDIFTLATDKLAGCTHFWLRAIFAPCTWNPPLTQVSTQWWFLGQYNQAKPLEHVLIDCFCLALVKVWTGSDDIKRTCKVPGDREVHRQAAQELGVPKWWAAPWAVKA